MKYRAAIIALLFYLAGIQGSAQSAAGGQNAAEQSQVRETWVDPSTGLVWAAKDNGKAVTWSKAMKYCGELKLGGYSGWRLATIDELASLVEKRPSTYDTAANTETVHLPMVRHVKGNLG